MYRCLLPSAADIGVHTAHRPPSSIYRYIGIYRYIYRYTMGAVSGGAYECTLHTSLLPLPVIYTDIYADTYIPIYTLRTGLLPPIYRYITYIYECIFRFFFLVFFPLKPLPPSFTRLDGSIPHTHTHISNCTCDYNSSFGGRLRHRLVAPVFHGSATLTRPMLQPYLNIS